MTRTRIHKHPASLLLGLVLLLCAVGVAACGGSSPSSSTSASVAGTSKTAGTASTATTTTGGSGGTTTGSTNSGTKGSTTSRHPKRRSAVKVATGSSPPAKRRVRASVLRLCLEKNGIKPHSSKSQGSTRAQLQAALAKCDPALLPKRGGPSHAKQRRALLAKPTYRKALARFTSCMRAHGVPDFPEANTSGSGPLYPAGSVKSTPQVRAAQKACIGQLSTH